MTLTISLDLPWPHRDLHPNSRCHWSVKAKHTKKARCDAGLLAVAAGARSLAAEALNVTLVFSPPDARHRDTDGMLSACKASLDGIADATGVDDSKFNLTIRRANPIKGGCIRVEISEAGAAP